MRGLAVAFLVKVAMTLLPQPLLGLAHKDFDPEGYGVDYETLVHQLSAHGRVDLVGKFFGVIEFSSEIGAVGLQSSPI